MDGGNIDIVKWSMIQILYLVEFADYNSQRMIGEGVNRSDIYNTGQCDDLGMTSGCRYTTENPIVYRGIENLWGNSAQFIDGIDYYLGNTNISTSDEWGTLSYNIDGSNDMIISKTGYDPNLPMIMLGTEFEDLEYDQGITDSQDSIQTGMADIVMGRCSDSWYGAGLFRCSNLEGGSNNQYGGGRLQYIP